MSQIVDATFDTLGTEIADSNVPVLVDYWAPWCQPCRIVSPLLESILQNYEGKVKLVKINVEKNQKLAKEQGIHSVPTLSVFVDKEMQETIVGMRTKEFLEKVLEKYVT